MKKYNVKVNGTTYEVEVEEVKGEFVGKQANVEVTDVAPKKVLQESNVQVKKAVIVREKIECPIPGTLIKVNVNVGDNVKKGQVMFILEAMKMENEIMAPHDAIIVEVNVAKGADVNTGDILAIIS
jgi:biotin carboxyl carrier protein